VLDGVTKLVCIWGVVWIKFEHCTCQQDWDGLVGFVLGMLVWSVLGVGVAWVLVRGKDLL